MKQVLLNLLFILCTFLGLSSCGKKSEKKSLPPQEVFVYVVEKQTLPVYFQNVGIVKSPHLVEVRARVTGYLDSIDFQEGSLVENGKLLYKIDPRPFEAEKDQAKAQLEQEQAVLWDAVRAYERIKPLREKNAASQRDLDNATANMLSAKANVDKAKAQLVQAELNLSYTKISAPVSGLVGASNVREGDLITPGGETPLTTITVIHPIWVEFSISENVHLKYNIQQRQGKLVFPKDDKFTIEVILSDGQAYQHTGFLNFASPDYNPKTGAMTLRATFPNPDNNLRPGQFVRAKVMGAKMPDAIAVPKKAVAQGQKGMYVYVVNNENKAEIRQIKVGSWYEDFWIIDQGLKEGDRVIVDGINKVLPGQSVNPVIKKYEL